MRRTVALALLVAALTAARADVDPELARHVYPLAPPKPAPKMVLNVSDFPESKKWGETAIVVMRDWFGPITSLLATQDWKAPKELRLVIKKDLSVPAYASGGTITVNGKWITAHPDDLGMVIHEMTHVIQSYPNSNKTPGWLVEGIADFTRWWRYEPEAPRPKLNYDTAKYTDAYRTTAYFLAWLTHHKDARIVPALDRAMRRKEDPMPVFEQMTALTVDELWKEFIATKP